MDKDEKIQEDKTLEELFAQLEDAIRKMEKEDISLEDSFSLYHKGMDMLKLCNEKIDKVEKKMLVLDEPVQIETLKLVDCVRNDSNTFKKENGSNCKYTFSSSRTENSE